MSSSLENKISDLQARLRAENGGVKGDPGAVEVNPFGGSRPGSGRRPKLLVDGTLTPTRTRKPLDLPGSNYLQPVHNPPDTSLLDQKKEIMKMTGIISIDAIKYKSDIKDLEQIGELGNGTCGHVVKMKHKPSQRVIAVKQMRRSGNAEENKRIAMDLEVVLMSHDCEYIVHCLGCFVTDSDVWICMELMGSCFDKLIKHVVKYVPEPILGKVTLATVKALHYLKENHGVMHRDVKPSNILIDEKGNVKLCDFGISGRLVDSKAKSMNAGCAAYMSPERINPPDPKKPDYDIRADVWSLGITLVELATGVFPYPDCKSDFEVLSRVMQEDPPSLPDNGQFSQEFIHFVQLCLVKDYRQRPKYKKLLEHPFIKRYETEQVDVASWYACAVAKLQNQTSRSKLESKCFCGFNHENRTSVPKERSNSGSSRHKPAQDWEKLKGVWNNILKSPLFNRRKKGVAKESKPGNKEEEPSRPPVSPLLLQRFLHQQIQHFNAVRPFRSPSLSPKYSPENKGGAFQYDEAWVSERERRGASMSPPLHPRRTDQFGRHSSRAYRVSPSPNWLVRSKSMADRSETGYQRNSDELEHGFHVRAEEQLPSRVQGESNPTNRRYENRINQRPHGQFDNIRDNPFNWRTEEPFDLRREDQIDRRTHSRPNLQPEDRNFYEQFDRLICRMEDQSNESQLNNRLDDLSPQTEDKLNRRIKDYMDLRKDVHNNQRRELQTGRRADDQYNARRQECLEEQVNQRMIDLFNMRLGDHSKMKSEEQGDHSRPGRRPPSPSASTSPEPPPRINKRVSPLLARRIAYNNSRMALRHQQSPSTPRRYNHPYQYSSESNSSAPALRSSSLPCSPILSSRNYSYDVRNYPPHDYTP